MPFLVNYFVNSTIFAILLLNFNGTYFDKILRYILREKIVAQGKTQTHDLKMTISKNPKRTTPIKKLQILRVDLCNDWVQDFFHST